MNILFITSVVPYPPNRGDKLRIFNVIKQLSKDDKISIISFVKKDIDIKNAEELRKIGYNIITIRLSRIISLLNLLRTLFTWEPLQVSFHFSKKMYSTIKKETTKNKFDIVYFHLFPVAQYHSSIKSKVPLKIYDMTDATVIYLERFLNYIKNPFKRFYFIIEMMLVRRYEKISQKFDVCYVCSNVDLRYLYGRKLNGNFRLLTNGFDTDITSNDNIKPHKYRIIFAGNMPYYPNKDAALFFAKEVFPLVKIKYPNATFYIVGQDPPKEILELNSSSIIVTGYVEDIKKEYLLSEINVAPIRFGAGIQNKIIEALALGVPTVASKITIESFDHELRKYIFSANTPEEYVDAIDKIFSENDIRNKYMKECQTKIGTILSWDNIIYKEKLYLEDFLIKKNA